MYITSERPENLHDRELDPQIPDADLSPTGEACGRSTTDVMGVEWACTRAPHTDSEHRSIRVPRRRPQGEVAIAWDSNWGEPANRLRSTKTITTTITCPDGTMQHLSDDDVRSIERGAWEGFDEDDHDEVTVTTAVNDGEGGHGRPRPVRRGVLRRRPRRGSRSHPELHWTRRHRCRPPHPGRRRCRLPLDLPSHCQGRGRRHPLPRDAGPAEYVVPVDPVGAFGCDSCQ